MRERQRPERGSSTSRPPDEATAKEGAFRTHLVVFLVTGLFLLSLNLLTSPTELWFYWPVFFWGWAVVAHALASFGADAPVRVASIARSLIPGGRSAPATRAFPEPDQRAPATPVSIDAVEARVKRLWRISRQIPDGGVRDQAFRLSAAADRVAEVMAADRTDPQTIAWFDDRLLAPTETMLTQYVRLRTRNVAGADATLRRVEEENLPAIESRIDALYDQLHRGAVVDLAVTSEMLEFELPERRVSG
jgi:hypothetical protein